MSEATEASGVGADRRYFDRQRQTWMVRVTQGNYHISSDADVVFQTVLGSCVSACVRDAALQIGGMNHFLLPEGSTRNVGIADPLASRYGSYAMELLVNGILSRGGQRGRLEVKLFGGGNVMQGVTGIGHMNAAFIEEYVTRERLAVHSKHLRGYAARRVEYHPVTGRARMLLLPDSNETVFREEARRVTRESITPAGEVELFD